MKHERGEMVAPRVHAPQDVVEAERQPRDGDVVTEVEAGEHPAEIRPAEPPVVRILYQVRDIVPVEVASERREKRDDGRHTNEERHDPAKEGGPPSGLGAHTVATVPGTCCRRQVPVSPPSKMLPSDDRRATCDVTTRPR